MLQTPIITVGLPLYRAHDLATIALESLCRQTELFAHNIFWELIVFEESTPDPIGKDVIDSFAERLILVNCKRIEYVALPVWLPLGQKWKLMAQAALPNSVGFLLQAADCYSHPLRLRQAFDLFMNSEADWLQARRGYFYDFISRRLLEFDFEAYPRGGTFRCSLDMAARTELMRHLPNNATKRFVDHWLFRTLEGLKGQPLNVGWTPEGDAFMSINTNGLGNITRRDYFFQNPSPPFKPADYERLSQCLPPAMFSYVTGEFLRNRARAGFKKVWELAL